VGRVCPFSRRSLRDRLHQCRMERHGSSLVREGCLFRIPPGGGEIAAEKDIVLAYAAPESGDQCIWCAGTKSREPAGVGKAVMGVSRLAQVRWSDALDAA